MCEDRFSAGIFKDSHIMFQCLFCSQNNIWLCNEINPVDENNNMVNIL